MTAAIRFPDRGAPPSIASRVKAAASSGLAAPERWLYEALTATPVASGVTVTPETAMRCMAVYACVRVLAESMAQLPLAVYRRKPDGGADEAPDHPLYALLHDAPNEWQTSFEWREMSVGHICLRGNAYAFVSRDGDRVLELLPLHPDRVTVEQKNDWSLRYLVRQGSGEAKEFTSRDVLHLRGFTSNGIVGVTPISHAREAIGLALAAENHGAQLFGNGATPGGVLIHQGKLSEEAAKRLKASWQAAHGGANRHGTAVLEEGLKWEQLGITNVDAQFLETRKFQRGEIASLFRVPPHLIGDLERATFSNIEQQSLEFVIHTLMPWVKRWEQRLSRQLLSERDRKTHFLRFKVDGLLRGDIAGRYDAYAVAITNGWMNRNEVRALEGLNRQDGLDEFLSPLNLAPRARGGAPAPEPQK
jgi:HK97 family phage portal protein